ncbi:MAG TPA: DUF979 family protein [Blastocatellia bacterium]|nr:DUF979 family protein [Blastocatellia bacterium]
MSATLAMSVGGAIGKVLSLDTVYVLTGLVLLGFAIKGLRDKQNKHRIGTGLFWSILAVIFILGSLLPHWVTGLLVIGMTAIDGAGRVARGGSSEATKQEQAAEATRLGNRIFTPVIVIPIVTFAFALALLLLWKTVPSWPRELDANRGALVGLGLGGLVAMFAAMRLSGGSLSTAIEEGRRLNEAMGSVNILPQLLASLGVIFTAAKVGDLVAAGIHYVFPDNSLFLLVLANCLGMALFTIVMGNSFAAFPVIAAGVLSPLIIGPFGVDPAMAGIITLTAGSSGTLMTPMAANFNIVPTALLNMRDQYGVIRFQLPFALTIWCLHVILLWTMIRLF